MSTLNTHFSSLSPEINGLLFGQQSGISAAMPASDQGIEGPLKQLADQISDVAKKGLPEAYANMVTGGLVKMVTNPLLIGKVGGLAALINSVSEGFATLRNACDKLSDAERAAFLRTLPPALRGPLEKDWKMPLPLQILELLGLIGTKANNFALSVGRKCLSKALSFAGKMTRTLIGAENQQLIANGLSSVGKQFISDICGDAASFLTHASKPLVKGVQPHLQPILEKLTKDFHHIDEILCNLDQVAQTLPPAKLANCLFSSAATFSEINKAAEKDAKNQRKMSQLRFIQLKKAAQERAFPTQEMNRGIELLLQDDSLSLDAHAAYLFDAALAEKDITPAENALIEERYQQFCTNHAPSPLLKKAFYLKSLGGDPEILFIADLILIKPEDALNPESLIERAGILFVKKELFPTLVKKLFPKDFPDLLSALSKLSGIDLNDKLGTLLGVEFMKRGLSLLTDKHLLSTIILNLLGAPSDHVEEYSPSTTDRREYERRLAQFCDSQGSEDYTNCLRKLSVERIDDREKNRRVMEAVRDVEDQFYDWANELPPIKKAVAGNTIRSLGADLLNLSRRQDWGLWLLLFAGELNQAILDPESAAALDLIDKESKKKINLIVKDLCPSTKWVPDITPFIQYYLENGQTMMQSYAEPIRSIKGALQMQSLVGYVINSIKFHSDQPFPSDIEEALFKKGVERIMKEHVKSAVEKIWGEEGAHFASSYVQFLLKQEPKKLFQAIQTTLLDVKDVRKQFISDREEKLAKELKALDQIFPHQFYNTKNKGKFHKLHQRLAMLQEELELLYKAEFEEEDGIVIHSGSLDEAFLKHHQFIAGDRHPHVLRSLKQKVRHLKALDFQKNAKEIEVLEKEIGWMEEDQTAKRNDIRKREYFYYRKEGKVSYFVKKKIQLLEMMLEEKPRRRKEMLDSLKFEYGIGYIDAKALEADIKQVQQCQSNLRAAKRKAIAEINGEIAQFEACEKEEGATENIQRKISQLKKQKQAYLAKSKEIDASFTAEKEEMKVQHIIMKNFEEELNNRSDPDFYLR